MNKKMTLIALAVSALINTGCAVSNQNASSNAQVSTAAIEVYGTQTPFASEAVYFVMTDRFVDGDPSNNYENQGGEYSTWQRPLIGPNGEKAYVGYMGGDLKGILNNAEYIADMGFTAVWMTPVHDNPDYAFNGDEPITYGGAFKDGGKTGYHGYWATNFYKADEHIVSQDLTVKAYTVIILIHDIYTTHSSMHVLCMLYVLLFLES
mgnify:CR=1 FL=1